MANWRIEVGYVGLDKNWHWGVMARRDKAQVKRAFNTFKDRERVRLYKDGQLVCEVNGPEPVKNPALFAEFLRNE